MPKTRAKAAAAKVVEPVMPAEPEEQVELDGSEEMEEEIEYEEVEEEVEEYEEEEEEVLEDEEEGDEIDEEVEEGDNAVVNGARTKANDPNKEDAVEMKDESKEHADLLALPPHGSEVYIGGIPPDATEKELRSLCETAGEVTEVRMMKSKDSSGNKGYAFVTFRTKELAATSIEKLDNIEFKGRKLKCSTSQAKHRLFIGNIPRSWTEDNLKKAVLDVGPGVTTVDLMKDPQNSSRNRGFAFIEYYNHACAEYSRKKMSVSKFKLDSNAPTVSWADPKSGDSSSQIKSVYVKNLPKDVNQDQLKKLFERHGEISKVVLPPSKSGQDKRFGFVHFAERSSAMKALKNTEKYEIKGEVLECSLAKPPTDKKAESGSSAHKSLPNYNVGYGIMGGAYGALAPSFAPSMLYGGRQAAAGAAMVPMMLPDGRIAYVVQQPGVPLAPPPHRGGRSSDGRKGNDNYGRRYNPY
ncbi:Polyadenylate-binding protein 5 [Platanthera zijinensis]|uniref:Polyadenylate-binding protein 5 n=1 Tax=Platanthera zijinensis TaxID=2320716 RepID=A0AAP0G176_9ASPA